MPIRGAVLTPTEVMLAREGCESLLLSITDRLLRGGLAGFADFRRRYSAECRRAMSASTGGGGVSAKATTGGTGAPPSSSVSSSLTSRSAAAAATAGASKKGEATAHAARRINPEGLKSVFAQCGVLFSPDEFRSVLVAYSDAVGFVLAEDLLADLHPCRRAPLNIIHASTAAVVEGLFSELPMSSDPVPPAETATGGDASRASVDFAAVTADGVYAALCAVFDPNVSEAEAQSEGVRGADDASLATALTSLRAGVEATFIAEVYPDGAVPAEDVIAFVVLSLQQYPSVSNLVLSRLRSAAPLAAASTSNVSGRNTTEAAASSSSASPSTRGGVGRGGLDGAALFSIRHAGVTTQRKFEYYVDSVDRRDEWMRGRVESDARPNYLRHAVGYGGHLPEYQYHFGRTFHVIEEDLPQLTKPKAPLEPVPADWYGEGVELKDSRMNAHHYRLA